MADGVSVGTLDKPIKVVPSIDAAFYGGAAITAHKANDKIAGQRRQQCGARFERG